MGGQGNILVGSESASGGSITPAELLALLTPETGIELDNLGATIGIKALVAEKNGVEVDVVANGYVLTNRLLYFFVTQYGATGNGVTDDTAAIQAAFTACGAAGGGVVFFPKGNYLVTALITWPANSTIRALGASGGDAIVSGTITGLSNIIATTAISVFSTSGNDDKIENLQFVGPVNGGAGTAVTSSGQNFEAINCGFYGFFNAIVLTKNELSRIARCGFREQQQYGISLSNSISADDGDATISDCVFTCSVAHMTAGVFQQGSGGTKLISCKFVSAGDMQYCYRGLFPAGNSTSDLLICNCSMEIQAVAAIFVQVSGAASFFNISIIGCNISSQAGGAGIHLIGTGAAELTCIAIVGNCISGNTTGIILTDLTGAFVVGNSFFQNSVADVSRSGTTVVNTGFAGDDNGAAPVNPAAPAAWSAVTLYTAAGPVVYKVPLYL